MNSVVYFVSGHIDITHEQFITYYAQQLDQAIDSHAHFVVGDSDGTDAFTQQYLAQRTRNVVVFHSGDIPKNHFARFKTKGGFHGHKSKDIAMTLESDQDIAWIRPVEEQKELYGNNWRPRKSGTQKNLERRQRIANDPEFYHNLQSSSNDRDIKSKKKNRKKKKNCKRKK